MIHVLVLSCLELGFWSSIDSDLGIYSCDFLLFFVELNTAVQILLKKTKVTEERYLQLLETKLRDHEKRYVQARN